MESDARYAIVGVVVVLLTVAVVAAILWLSDDGLGQEVDLYAVYFQEQSLAGLQIDSDVTMRGIKVGSVKSVAISESNIEQVQVILRLNSGVPIKTDSQAVIQRNLLTGLAWMDIVGSSQEAPLLKDNTSSNQAYPVIPEGKTELEAIADSIPDLLEEVSEIAQRINSFLSEENHARLNGMMTNLETFSKTLASNDEALSALIGDAAAVTRDLKSVSASWKDITRTANARIDEVTREAVAVMAQLRESAVRLDRDIQVIAQAARNVADVITVEITSVSTAVGEASRAISRVAQKFEEPEGIIFGPNQGSLGPGETIPK